MFSLFLWDSCFSQEDKDISNIKVIGDSKNLESIEYIGEKGDAPVFRGDNNRVYQLKNGNLKDLESNFQGTPLYINSDCCVFSKNKTWLRVKNNKSIYKVPLDDGLYYDYPLYANKSCDSIFYSDSFGNIRLVRFNGQKYQTSTLFEGMSPFLIDGSLYFVRYKNKSSPAPDVELYEYDFSRETEELLVDQTHPSSVFVISKDLIFCAILKDGDYKDVIFDKNKGKNIFTGTRYFIKGYYPFQYEEGEKLLFYHPSEFKIKTLSLSN